jgi:hypothetical protein
MSIRTRLALSTITAILALLGMALSFYVMLPDLADELVRRKDERRLDEAASQLTAQLRDLGAPMRETLAKLSADSDLASLAIGPDADAQAMTGHWELAQELCRRYGLASLKLIHTSGTLVSLYPDAAKVGMTDPEALALARLAASTPVFITPDQGDRADVVAALALAESLSGGGLLALTTFPLTHRDVTRVAAGLGVGLPKRDAPQEESPAANMRLVAVNGADGQKVADITLVLGGNEGEVLRGLLIRGIAMTAAPWVLGAAFILILIGWPTRRRADD